MKNIDFVQALKDGREVVVIAADTLADSAVFFVDGGTLFSFSRAFGVMKRDDLSFEEVRAHFARMLSEGAQLFIRGCDE